MASNPDIISVRALLPDADGRLLMVQRIDPSFDAGKWELPGGKVKQFIDEEPRDTVVRETLEETGLQVKVVGSPTEISQYMIRDGRHAGKWVISLGFRVVHQSGILGTGRDPMPVAWRSPDELTDPTMYTRVALTLGTMLSQQLVTL